MKVTKYPQSCLVIEEDGVRIAIDPGMFVAQKFRATDLLPLDGILLTHEHPDHVDPKLIEALVGQTAIPVVGNQSTATLFGGVVNKVVGDGEEFQIKNLSIKTHELPHVPMVDGKPGPQNTGYIINQVFFHPGDGLEVQNLEIKKAAVPIAGPDVSPKDIYGFITALKCEVVIPIHYDYFPADPNFYHQLLNSYNLPLKFLTLNNGETADI